MEEAREDAGPMVEAESDWRRGVEGEIWSGRGASVGDAISVVLMVLSSRIVKLWKIEGGKWMGTGFGESR